MAAVLTIHSSQPQLSAQDQAAVKRQLAGGLTPEERVNIAVYDKVNRSVVNIETRMMRAEMLFMTEAPAEGAGSGSVLDYEGHILTNYHVIENAREIRVTLSNGGTYKADVMGADPVYDMAVLRIEAPRELLYPVEFGDSSLLRVGQKIYALGNPFGLERTMTVGIISSLNRSLATRTGRTIADLIIAVDGRAVHSADDLLTIIERKRPGDEVVVTVVRENTRINVSVVLGAGE